MIKVTWNPCSGGAAAWVVRATNGERWFQIVWSGSRSNVAHSTTNDIAKNMDVLAEVEASEANGFIPCCLVNSGLLYVNVDVDAEGSASKTYLIENERLRSLPRTGIDTQ